MLLMIIVELGKRIDAYDRKRCCKHRESCVTLASTWNMYLKKLIKECLDVLTGCVLVLKFEPLNNLALWNIKAGEKYF